MADKAKHAFGALERVDESISKGIIDSYDILFVKDADGKPYVGWVDKDGNKVIVQEDDEVVVVNSLPESGEVGKIYVFEENAFVWNGSEFTNLCKPTDVSALESQIAELETEITTKVDAKKVQTMIEEYADSVVEVVEF
ncbi:MAG: hypothetical protein J6R59_09755 [Paludibacteraceae bacterium]|nr:hypothetical protein [Paludibacteraceae bacterium]